MVRIILGVSVALTIVWMTGEILAVGMGFLWRRRRTRRHFERRLRRNGLPEDVIEELSCRYHSGGLLRGLMRSKEP